ncbi:hypothetical protein BD779DRAFT_1668267 [Infundibulicybe gibba]|nr:hypothetical protein BD779DRAFT_1668267 [Infundibulicybe gibba]
MPRRASARTNTSVEEPALHSLPSSSPDALIILRSHWKWAAFSQFFYTFAPLLAMSDVALSDIETDFIAGQNAFLPRVMTRLLYTLSYDRKVSLDNWQTALRKQYNKRDPQANPIGQEPANEDASQPQATTRDSSIQDYLDQRSPGPSEPVSSRGHANNTPDEVVEYQESKDWLDLPMLAKLDSMYLVSEWQFHNPTRLRTLMKSDDETASWRIEPVGYDSKRNAYWFIGDRLWIQRHIPSPPRTRKRKRSPVAKTNKTSKAKPPVKRPRVGAGGEGRQKANQSTANGGRSSRAAKAQANLKLDAQARELAELNRQAQIQARAARQTRTGGAARGRPLGTRLSARLRGVSEDDWQAIPDEWLASGAERSSPSDDDAKGEGARKTGLESDDAISDLTDLTEESEKEEVVRDETPSREPSPTPPPQSALPEGFLEWETICVTLFEWEHVAERFEKATHYAEKALYKLLVNNIVPFVTEEMREAEKKIRLEEALVHRKRSSRIAIKESEKEEARAAARKRAEEEEKMSRARRMELRQQKEEADRLKREAAREQRRQERETKEAQENRNNSSESPTPNPYLNGETPRSRPPGGDWELDCEICHVRGFNMDDGMPMMSCGHCSKWQHIICHDRADESAGRPKRNWDMVEFVCERCRCSGGSNSSSNLLNFYFNDTLILHLNPNTPLMVEDNTHILSSNPIPHHSLLATTNHNSARYSFQAPVAYGQSAWNVTTPTIGVTHHANTERSGGVDYRQPYHPDPRHAPPQNQFTTTQFRYHPTSYGA